jgi:hypothetical protein
MTAYPKTTVLAALLAWICACNSSADGGDSYACPQTPPEIAATPGTVLAVGVAPWGLAIDEERVYWTDYAARRVLAAPQDGSASVTVLYEINGSPSGIAASGDELYFATHAGEIWRGRKAADAPPQLLADGQAIPNFVRIWGDELFWGNRGTVDGTLHDPIFDDNGAIMHLPLSGGEPTAVVDGLREVLGLAVDESGVYAAVSLPEDGGSRAIIRVPHEEEEPTTIVPVIEANYGLAVHKGTIFWAQTHHCSIWRADITGRNAAEIVGGQIAPSQLAVDESGLFWTNGGQGADYAGSSVMRANLDGSSATALASGRGASAIELSPSHVLWTNSVYDEGTVAGAVRPNR